MSYERLTKYQLSARVRALRAEHRYLAGQSGSLPRLQEIRRELTKLLSAQSSQRAVTLLSRALAVEGATRRPSFRLSRPQTGGSVCTDRPHGEGRQAIPSGK